MQTFFLFDIAPEIYALQTIFMFGQQNSATVLGRSIMLGLWNISRKWNISTFYSKIKSQRKVLCRDARKFSIKELIYKI